MVVSHLNRTLTSLNEWFEHHAHVRIDRFAVFCGKPEFLSYPVVLQNCVNSDSGASSAV